MVYVEHKTDYSSLLILTHHNYIDMIELRIMRGKESVVLMSQVIVSSRFIPDLKHNTVERPHFD